MDILVCHLSRLFEFSELVTIVAQSCQGSGLSSLLLHWLSPQGDKMAVILPSVLSSHPISQGIEEDCGLHFTVYYLKRGGMHGIPPSLFTFHHIPEQKSEICLQWRTNIGQPGSNIYTWNSLLHPNRSHIYQLPCMTTLGIDTHVRKVPVKDIEHVCIMPRHSTYFFSNQGPHF